MKKRKSQWRLAVLLTACANILVVMLTGQVQAAEAMKINYSGYVAEKGWTIVSDDNQGCMAGEDGYFTAMKANLLNQPDHMTGTVSYQVCMKEEGWIEWGENGIEMGNTSGQLPMEAIRLKLTGQLTEHYDIYYAVFQKGVWSSWSVNGAASGTEGEGIGIDGIKISVTAKGAGVPKTKKEVPGKIDPQKPMIALTFDDGPNAAVTNRILDVLEKNGARATFFMVGNRVVGKANTSSVQRMSAIGCETANHTYEHKTLTKLSREGAKSQLDRANDMIGRAGGKSPILMRPPGGAKDQASLATVDSMEMYAIMWSVDTLDWKTKDKNKIVDAVLNEVKDGDIVLMHDLYSTTADAVEVIVPKLIERGYQLVTVSEMAASRGGLKPGRTYSNFYEK